MLVFEATDGKLTIKKAVTLVFETAKITIVKKIEGKPPTARIKSISDKGLLTLKFDQKMDFNDSFKSAIGDRKERQSMLRLTYQNGQLGEAYDEDEWPEMNRLNDWNATVSGD